MPAPGIAPKLLYLAVELWVTKRMTSMETYNIKGVKT